MNGHFGQKFRLLCIKMRPHHGGRREARAELNELPLAAQSWGVSVNGPAGEHGEVNLNIRQHPGQMPRRAMLSAAACPSVNASSNTE